jgi:hypothetical protein
MAQFSPPRRDTRSWRPHSGAAMTPTTKRKKNKVAVIFSRPERRQEQHKKGYGMKHKKEGGDNETVERFEIGIRGGIHAGKTGGL